MLPSTPTTSLTTRAASTPTPIKQKQPKIEFYHTTAQRHAFARTQVVSERHRIAKITLVRDKKQQRLIVKERLAILEQERVERLKHPNKRQPKNRIAPHTGVHPQSSPQTMGEISNTEDEAGGVPLWQQQAMTRITANQKPANSVDQEFSVSKLRNAYQAGALVSHLSHKMSFKLD
jgi:hypothetical protein